MPFSSLACYSKLLFLTWFKVFVASLVLIFFASNKLQCQSIILSYNQANDEEDTGHVGHTRGNNQYPREHLKHPDSQAQPTALARLVETDLLENVWNIDRACIPSYVLCKLMLIIYDKLKALF